ncbi:hypothetical protein [Fibrivirga algicola]|uniref:Right-handed parallel beta-helix repeat-containing protein n=1 Tax=Fibrivirga algicola TaxID=2950420 RepID=A0ABX0QR63_9BACT|nr:hypothetical protein [Fibrivirga algicola]NID13791.1 hypothetical protein [Fibrivirga algicola]
MRRTCLLFCLLLATTLAQAQMTYRKNGTVIEYSYKKGPWTPLTSTPGSVTTTPTAFTNLTGIPAYLTSTALNAKLETSLYTVNRLNDRAEVEAVRVTANAALPASTYTTNRAADLGAIGAAQTTADQALPTTTYNTNRATDLAAIGAAQTTANAAVPTTTYNANRTADQTAARNPANLLLTPLLRLVTDSQITRWDNYSLINNWTATSIRGLFNGNGLIQYDNSMGNFYSNATEFNLMLVNYLKSRDGYATGKVLSTDGTNLLWVTPTSTTVTSGSSTSATGGTPATSHYFADSTVNRVNYALMVDVPLSTTAQIQSFLTTAQINKRGIIAPASYTLASNVFTQTGAWDNVALTAPSGATFVATAGATSLFFTNTHTVKRAAITGITFTTTWTGAGNAAVFTNELVTFQGLEFARCKWIGANAGNWNAFNITQYSTSSNSGATSSDFYMHDCEFINIPRMPVEILSQGYDAVRLTNVTLTNNRFTNSAANTGEVSRMATSFSGLITGIYHAKNYSKDAKTIAYEFVNVKYSLAESNTAVGSIENAVGYSVTDDGRNTTEQIYFKGGHISVLGRPMQFYGTKDIHVDGGYYYGRRSVDVKSRQSSFENLTVLVQSTTVEQGWQFDNTSVGNTLKNSTISSFGALAAGLNPYYESVIFRSGTSDNVLTNLILRRGKKDNVPSYYTNGQPVSQGMNNTWSSITVESEL